MKYSERRQDLFQVDPSYHLAHCIAADLRMGAGIAVAMQNAFGLRRLILQSAIASGREIKCPDCILTGRVFNLITKARSSGKPTYRLLGAALRRMKTLALENGVTRIAMPKIGCGLDRLDWRKVRDLVQEKFGDTDIEILVCLWDTRLEGGGPEIDPPGSDSAKKEMNLSSGNAPVLFTIGYAGMALVDFMKVCEKNRIDVIADVRSSPYSRFAPDFCKERLEKSLPARGFKYVFLGRELGARREEPECYEGGRALYERIERTEAFQSGIARLRKGVLGKGFRVALLCAEKDPLDCHRFALICRHLKSELGDIRHIIGDRVETNAETEQRLLGRYNRKPDLFQTREQVLEDVYREHGFRIAYQVKDLGRAKKVGPSKT